MSILHPILYLSDLCLNIIEGTYGAGSTTREYNLHDACVTKQFGHIAGRGKIESCRAIKNFSIKLIMPTFILFT